MPTLRRAAERLEWATGLILRGLELVKLGLRVDDERA
jgi:hypothetical protein